MKLPDPAMYTTWQEWAREVNRRLEEAGNEVSLVMLPSIAKADLPRTVEGFHALAYVPNASGGATLAFSTASEWRRVQDLAVIS